MREHKIFLGIILFFIAVSGASWLFRGASQYIEIKIGETTFRVETADTPEAWARGLSGRSALPERSGMLFRFPEKRSMGFWMKEMIFSIDIVWISDGKVIGVAERLPLDTSIRPTTYYPPGPVTSVLEINAGEAERYGITVGSEVAIIDL
jgi:uncharacterized membrane protein (UPF0127 family)